jgi:hypothetical protein
MSGATAVFRMMAGRKVTGLARMSSTRKRGPSGFWSCAAKIPALLGDAAVEGLIAGLLSGRSKSKIRSGQHRFGNGEVDSREGHQNQVLDEVRRWSI